MSFSLLPVIIIRRKLSSVLTVYVDLLSFRLCFYNSTSISDYLQFCLRKPSQLNMRSSPLHILPYELRMMIYRRILSKPIIVLRRVTEPARRLVTDDVRATILRVCKLFHAEATSILYVENTFCLDPYHQILFTSTFLPSISPTNAESINSLYFRSSTIRPYMFQNMLSLQSGNLLRWCKGLPGLREMRLPCKELVEQGIREGRDGEGGQRVDELGKGEYGKLLRQAFHDVATALQGVKVGLEAERGGIWKLYLGPRREYVRLIALGDPRIYAERDVSTAWATILCSRLTLNL